MTNFKKPILSLLVIALCAALSPLALQAQGDGPRTQLLMPVGTNVFAPTYLGLSSNFNFNQSILIKGADISSDIGVGTYTRSFALGGRYAQFWINPIWGSIDGNLAGVDPRSGQLTTVSVSESGLADPYFAFKIGLIGAPALELADFMKHAQSFQMHAYVGAYVPVGDYDEDRSLNLGTNRWAFRFGFPMVLPLASPQSQTYLEIHPGVVIYGDNDEPTGNADLREQDPLFLLETHLSRNFTPKFWGSIDLRYQNGGGTTTDHIDDDNRLGQLGGGITLGYSFTRSLALLVGYGEILAENDDSVGEMLRVRMTYAF